MIDEKTVTTSTEATDEGGFDQAIVVMPDGEKKVMTRQQFALIPLSERIQIILQKKVEFRRDGKPVSIKEATRR